MGRYLHISLLVHYFSLSFNVLLFIFHWPAIGSFSGLVLVHYFSLDCNVFIIFHWPVLVHYFLLASIHEQFLYCYWPSLSIGLHFSLTSIGFTFSLAFVSMNYLHFSLSCVSGNNF